jgi:hypothetical protein
MEFLMVPSHANALSYLQQPFKIAPPINTKCARNIQHYLRGKIQFHYIFTLLSSTFTTSGVPTIVKKKKFNLSNCGEKKKWPAHCPGHINTMTIIIWPYPVVQKLQMELVQNEARNTSINVSRLLNRIAICFVCYHADPSLVKLTRLPR